MAAAAFFPAEDRQFTFSLFEGGKFSDLTEHLVREGNQVVAVQGEKVYLTWHLTGRGVYRRDPKNPAALLRYLPPTLVESAWRQQSGDAQVLFRLKPGQEDCPRQHDEVHLACRQLTVINRGEQLDLWFLEGIGPVKAVNEGWANSRHFFNKRRTHLRAGAAEAAQRQRWLDAADKPPGELPTVETLDLQEFTRLANRHHWDVQPAATVSQYDLLDGDGTGEWVRGPLNPWTAEPVSFYRQDYTPLGKFEPSRGQHRVTPVTFDGYRVTFFLQETGGEGEQNEVTILGYHEGGTQPGHMVVGWGWDHKTSSTPATTVRVDPRGQITVVWNMGDPAQHTRTRVYRFTGFKQPAGFGIGAVELLSSEIAPTRGELVYPTEPLDVLTAAFNALWLEQMEELNRYFVSQQGAAQFVQVQQMPRPQYGLGTVESGKLAPSSGAWSGMTIHPAPVGADGSTEFYATVGGYEWGAAQWGRASFVRNSEGRWVLERVEISGSHFAGA